MLGKYSCFCCHLLTVFKIIFSRDFFRNTNRLRVTNSIDPDQDRLFVQTVCKGNQQYKRCCVKYLLVKIRADPDKMSPYAAHHLGFHHLPKYLFTGIQNEKD